MLFTVPGALTFLMSCDPPTLGVGREAPPQEAAGLIEEWRVDDLTTVTQLTGAWHLDLQPWSLSTSARPSPSH